VGIGEIICKNYCGLQSGSSSVSGSFKLLATFEDDGAADFDGAADVDGAAVDVVAAGTADRD
jgi:hypothetical protein